MILSETNAKPKLGPHFPKMREALAKSLNVSPDTIHLKATTNEGVDAIGRGEAIASFVVATLTPNPFPARGEGRCQFEARADD